jgi:hypothetical protein
MQPTEIRSEEVLLISLIAEAKQQLAEISQGTGDSEITTDFAKQIDQLDETNTELTLAEKMVLATELIKNMGKLETN